MAARPPEYFNPIHKENPMQEENMRQRLRQIVGDTIEINDFRDDQNFTNELGVNSMLAIEVLARIEKEYRIRFPEVVMYRVQTFNDIVALTEATLTEAAAS